MFIIYKNKILFFFYGGVLRYNESKIVDIVCNKSYMEDEYML